MRAFTLVELLISVLIILMIAVVAIPNVKKFSQDQQLEDAANNVIQALKQAQSGAMSGIKCETTGSPASKEWHVNISTSSYELKVVCETGSDDQKIPLSQYSSNPPDMITRLPSISSCTNSSNLSKIIFKKNSVSSVCADEGSISASVIYFVLKNTRNNEQKQISIEPSGVINKKVYP